MTPLAAPSAAEERAFLQSVIYAALFDYPLTPAQLRESLIGQPADEPALLRWYQASAYLQAAVEYADGFFFPRGRRDVLRTRAEREAISRRMLQEITGPLRLMTRMPFVRLVALSGSLAHLNASDDADLDLFVITCPGRVWTVTVAALLVARLLGWRKRLCLNYVISERALWIAPADLFSANQIVNLQPITGSKAYWRFLDANRFVQRFYPNFLPRDVRGDRHCPVLVEGVINLTMGAIAERACRWLYRAHLRRRAHTWRSGDQVRLDRECLKLHTSSHRREVMERFEQALKEAVAAAEQEALRHEESSPSPASV
ncbi:MAG TPA: hypothetical protein VMO26_14850 [Vicinamibacterales bacterium]|nr:hypothetical protein [Vicinamibacterales bacterium]